MKALLRIPLLAMMCLATCLLSACESGDTQSQPPPQPRFTVPTLRVPTLAPTFRPSPQQPAPTPNPQAPQTPNYYSLTTGQAIGYLEAGIAVAGRLPDGREGLAIKTETTEWEDKQVLENVCEQEYDYYEEKTVTKCRDKYVYKRVPVAKTIYTVSNGVARRTFSQAAAAIGNIAQYGAKQWRIA